MKKLMAPKREEIFQRSLTAHLPPSQFDKLCSTTILVAGLGGGSNIAELLARKGFGRLIIADPDVYEPHNVRQRGSLVATWGREKTKVMEERLLDINPFLDVEVVREGIQLGNVEDLVRRAHFIVDMLDFHALREKVALHQAARSMKKVVVTAPSVVNGAVLYVFTPEGPTFEEFFGYEAGLAGGDLGTRFLKRLIVHFPPEAPEELYRAAARGERTIPLDAVGVEQASVMAVAALENLALGRAGRVITVPRGLQVDLSDPAYLVRILDFSGDFPERR